jgi:ketosteroid isomerase-like protein
MSDYRRLVDDFRKAMFVDHDSNAIRNLYTEDAVLIDPNNPTPLRGRDAIAEYHGGFLQAFPDLSAEVVNVFGSGEWFAAEFRISGTHTGPLEAAPGEHLAPTGEKIDTDICWIGRLAPDGRCAEDHSYFDNSVFARLFETPPQQAQVVL